VDSGALAPIEDRVAKLAEEQRVVNNGEVIAELMMHVPNLARFEHPRKNKRIMVRLVNPIFFFPRNYSFISVYY
jgi:hypothetical protein